MSDPRFSQSSQITPASLHNPTIWHVFLGQTTSASSVVAEHAQLKQVARTNAMASEVGGTAASAGGGEGYGVLMISDALGATEVIALEKVRPVGQRLVAHQIVCAGVRPYAPTYYR